MLLAFVALSAWQMWPGRELEPQRFHGATMGTTYNVTVASRPLDDAARRAVQAAIDRELAAVDAEMSNYREDSNLARFNADASREPVPAPAALVELKNDPAYNEAWPRAVVPYSDVHGVPEPFEIPWLPNDGAQHAELPVGTPFGLVGTSSFYHRESFPGVVG